MNHIDYAYQMPTGMLLHEAGKQFAMAEIVRDSWQQVVYQRGGWFLLLVHAERTDGVQADVFAEVIEQLPPGTLDGDMQ